MSRSPSPGPRISFNLTLQSDQRRRCLSIGGKLVVMNVGDTFYPVCHNLIPSWLDVSSALYHVSSCSGLDLARVCCFKTSS